MGSHHGATATDDWLTPRWILDALGPFDLDPCDTAEGWTGAARHFSWADDGLGRSWDGRVWLNPPYGSVDAWIARLAEHGDGIALTFARTETSWFQASVWQRAEALLFFAGRLHFRRADGGDQSGNAGAPSVLIAYGPTNAAVLEGCGIPGAFVERFRFVGKDKT
jgi:hypothetical protein